MSGWAVEVRFQYVGGGWSPPQVWYASVSDKAEAERRVRETANVSEDVKVEAKAEISDTTFEGLKMPPDQARQWI